MSDKNEFHENDMVDDFRFLAQRRKEQRAIDLLAAEQEFRELAKVACSGDLTLRAPGPAHWTLSRRRGNSVIAQYWPSAQKIQLQGEPRSRPCTLEQFRTMLHDKYGCPPVRGEAP